MKVYYVINLFVILLISISSSAAHREEECVEVGFARASHMNVINGYEAAKEEFLTKWVQEDKEKKPLYKHFTPSLKNITRSALLLEHTTKNILSTIRKTRVGKRCPEEWLIKGLEKHVTPLMNLDKELSEELGLAMAFRCLVGSPYPNVDGTCNHEDHPDLGSIGSKFLRLIAPVSGKGGFTIRQSVDGEKTLPTARSVAELIRRHLKPPKVTFLFGEFGHFIARDSFSIPESPWVEEVDCCKDNDHFDCEPIYVEPSDKLYSSTKCINYKRSTPAQAILGHRESLSMVSSFFDANPVFGATNEGGFKRKTGYFGYLKSPELEDEESKSKKKSKKECGFPSSFKGCFKIQEDPNYLENFDLLLLLQHNHIADKLAEINPHFDDSLLYNEARRITIAIYNNILYGEYLPILLGDEIMNKHSLLPGSEGPGVRFIPEVNPGILTSFAMASVWTPAMKTEWKSEWGKTNIFDSLQYESIAKGSYQDLLAVDVQKGRDHGLAALDTWNGFCDTGNSAASWDDLESTFTKDIIEDLKKLYQDEIRDIDLIVALLEKPREGAVLGRIFICILADQFARLKTGNRFYWEHDEALFTHEQRDSIKQYKAADLLCEHLSLKALPSNPFLPISESNPEVVCKDRKSFDISPWEDIGRLEIKKEEGEDKDKEATNENNEIKDEEEGKTEEKVKKPVIKTLPDDKSEGGGHIEL